MKIPNVFNFGFCNDKQVKLIQFSEGLLGRFDNSFPLLTCRALYAVSRDSDCCSKSSN